MTKRPREEVDREAFKIGKAIRKQARKDVKSASVKHKAGRFGPKLRVLDRFSVSGKAKGLRAAKADKAINRIYRAAWKGMDELFSTALTREIVKGILDGTAKTGFTDAEWERLVSLVDLASQARISTQYSGFATKGRVMQHPASRTKAVFADPYATASEHSSMDAARRSYVQKALNKAVEAGGGGTAIITAGVKASIEFTLNYFTAPITADNVFKYSRRSGPFTVSDQLQIAERERLKGLYETLGGTLRAPSVKSESAAASRKRPWGLGLKSIEPSGGFPQAPPSPRRTPQLPKFPP